MNRIRRSSARSAWRLALIGAASFAVACGGPPRAPSLSPSPSAAPTQPAYVFHGRGTATEPVKLQNVNGGKTVYDLKATDVFYSTSSSKGRFLNDRIAFYRGNAVRLTVTAPIGDVDRTTYDFILRNGVTAVSPRGVRLTSDTMSYDGKSGTLTAQGHVRAVDSQGDVLLGDKAVSDLDLQDIHMIDGDLSVGR